MGFANVRAGTRVRSTPGARHLPKRPPRVLRCPLVSVPQAEAAVCEAHTQHGLPALVVRLGNMGWDSRTGVRCRDARAF